MYVIAVEDVPDKAFLSYATNGAGDFLIRNDDGRAEWVAWQRVKILQVFLTAHEQISWSQFCAQNPATNQEEHSHD